MLNKKYIKIVILLLFFILVYIYTLIAQRLNISIDCPIYELTGFYCPGCGITRMFIAIFSLDFYQAFRYNPLLFILLIVYIGYIIIEIVFKKTLSNKMLVKIGIILVFIVLIYTILRNTELFSFLKPTKI